MDVEALKGFVSKITKDDLSPDDVGNYDPELVEQIFPICDAVLTTYFRSEVRGIENIPDGPALIIGNHNAGITFLEPFILGVEWYRKKGFAEPFHFIAHDAMVSIPVLKNFLIRCGAIRANYENAYKVLDAGHKVAIFPGGNHEAFRSFRDRFKIDFGGHKGFAKVAIERNVPIVPEVNVGGHETFFVLTPGHKLAKLLRTDKILRSKTCAVSIALPFIISVGPVFHFPLPAKTEIEIGPPIYPDKATAGIEDFDSKVDRLYEVTVDTLQKIMDGMARKRRFPVIG